MSIAALATAQNPWWEHPRRRMASTFPIRRHLQPSVLQRLLRSDEHRALVLMGPRQVGKSTLLLQVVDDLLDRGWPPANLTYFDFEDERVTDAVTARDLVDVVPEGLDADRPRIFLLDEIARVPRWDRWLKQAVDRRTGRIVATDSAASLVRQAGRESGPGRWDEAWLEGLSFREFVGFARPETQAQSPAAPSPRFLEPYLLQGGFPEYATWRTPAQSDDSQAIFRKLRQDVVDRALLRDLAREVDDPDPLRALFVYLVQASGAILNVAKRASDVGHDARTVGKWLRLLEDTLLLVRLPRFAEHPATLLRARPKVFAADHGLVNAFALLDPNEPEVRGRVFETAVFRHLREVQRADSSVRLSYFHDGRQLEGDFVVQLPNSTVAVEVTSSPRPKREKLERLRAVSRKVHADRRILVHGGMVEHDDDKVTMMPLFRLLSDPDEALRR
jgi:uncharacterized protein